MSEFITANMARKMAFYKVNTTYEECFDYFLNAIMKCIEEDARKGKLDIHLGFNSTVDKYFKDVKSNDLYDTLKEVIKEKLSNLGFKVSYLKYNYSPDTTLIISW